MFAFTHSTDDREFTLDFWGPRSTDVDITEDGREVTLAEFLAITGVRDLDALMCRAADVAAERCIDWDGGDL